MPLAYWEMEITKSCISSPARKDCFSFEQEKANTTNSRIAMVVLMFFKMLYFNMK